MAQINWNECGYIGTTEDLSLETWNIGLIFMDQGSSNRYARGFILRRILNRPMYQGASFLDSTHNGKSLEAKHTRWPGQNVGAMHLLHLFISDYVILWFASLGSCLQGCSGPLPDPTTLEHHLFRCRDPHLLLLLSKHGWRVAKLALEQ